MARTRIDYYADDEVPANNQIVQTWPTIPTGEIWYLTHFGGASTKDSMIALQIMQGGNWVTMRAVAGPGQGNEFFIDREYTGDGMVRFRVVRQNTTSSPQKIAVWLEAFKKA